MSEKAIKAFFLCGIFWFLSLIIYSIFNPVISYVLMGITVYTLGVVLIAYKIDQLHSMLEKKLSGVNKDE